MSNKYAFSLIHEARSRFSVDASDMSMSDWVCKNTTLRGMPFNFRKFPFQKQICDDMHPNLSCMKISQVGLALDLDTPILTDKGWSTMGQLQVGEFIYAPDGSKTPVTYLSPVYHDHECYELTFCDGEKIVADAGHRWYVLKEAPEVLTTQDLYHDSAYPTFHIPALPGLEQGDTTQVLRNITAIVPVPPRPVRCLTVAHPDHLFLAGRGLITTHNTEIQVRKAAAFVTRNRGRTLIFTFPNEEMQKKTSQTRIQPLLTDNKVFNLSKDAGVSQIRSYNIIQIDSSFLLVTGCTEGEATSTPADAVFNDEVDLSPQDKLALFSSRMQASDLKIRQAFSTPTFEGFGIAQTFETSDQHEYFIKCDHCNHWQVPLFDKRWVRTPGLSDDIPLMELDQNILDKFRLDLDSFYIHCEKCHRGLDLGRADNRNWVPKYPHRKNSRGYRVRPFSVSTLSPGYIVQKLLEYKLKGFLRGWYNTVLGETYQDGDIRLNDAVIEACFGTPVVHNDQARRIPTLIGIDLGLVCHITLLQPKGGTQEVGLENMETVLFETVKADDLIERVGQLLKDYLIVGGTCDRHPYTPTANELFEMSNGLIVPCEYRGNAEISDKIDTAKCIQANRTDLLDTVANLIRRGRIRLSGFGTQRDVIREHLKDMVRDESPEKPATWVKLNGQDHYFHSLGFALTAVKIYTGDYTGPGHEKPEARSTVFIGGVDMSAQQALQGMLTHRQPTKSNFKQGGSFRQGLGLR